MAGGVVRQMIWFVVIGVLSTASQTVLYVALREWWSPQPANVAALLVTTVANTEAHRWVTFPGSQKPPLRIHLQALVPLLGTYLYTSLALAALTVLVSGASRVVEVAALVTVTALGGLVRFVVLRSWVFRSPRDKARTGAPPPAAVKPRSGSAAGCRY